MEVSTMFYIGRYCIFSGKAVLTCILKVAKCENKYSMNLSPLRTIYPHFGQDFSEILRENSHSYIIFPDLNTSAFVDACKASHV